MAPILKNPKFVQEQIVQVLASNSTVDAKAISDYLEKNRGALQFERTTMLSVFGFPPSYNNPSSQLLPGYMIPEEKEASDRKVHLSHPSVQFVPANPLPE